MPTVEQILAQYLRAHGYDGLCLRGNEYESSCGCAIDDLFPCSAPGASCRPGYRGRNADGDMIFTTRKPRAKKARSK